MVILGIETSCDETAAAVLTSNDERITILSNVVASSAKLQAKYGGIIPEQAAREQIKSIIPVIQEALSQAFPNVIPANAGIQLKNNLWIPDQVRDDKRRIPAIDAIAVTFGPGLIGSLLVGVETAKTLSLVWNKPIIPVNHLLGHFYANWIATTPPTFPCLGLLVSGGHTDLVLFTNHGKYKYLGGTRDDAAGECFDKCARQLGLPYPGGPQISKLAENGDPKAFDLPRPMIDSDDFDFSFSGLKTAVANLISEKLRITQKTSSSENQTHRKSELSGILSLSESFRTDLAASIEQTIVDVLVAKTIKATQKYQVSQIMIAGGVAANQKLVSKLKQTMNDERLTINLHVPPPHLCTDNGAMIAAAAFFINKKVDPLNLQADPNLSL